MGLFSKKPKEPEYDAEDCERKKKRMREVFNETVKDGDTYEVLYACRIVIFERPKISDP